MLRLSVKSRRAYGRLQRRYNDCDVYVEDSSLVGVHERVVNAALAGKGTVSRVIPLGSRAAVLKAANEDRAIGGRPRLYIVDGDLETIWRGKRRGAPHLYVLRVYELENVLLTPLSMENAIVANLSKFTKQVALSKINPVGLISEVDLLAPYLFLLAVAQRMGLTGRVFSLSPSSVSRRSKGLNVGIDQRKIEMRCLEICREARKQVGHSTFLREFKSVRKMFERKKLSAISFVPGKKFILYYLRNRIAAGGGSTQSDSAICGLLSLYVDFQNEMLLRRRLRSLLP